MMDSFRAEVDHAFSTNLTMVAVCSEYGIKPLEDIDSIYVAIAMDQEPKSIQWIVQGRFSRAYVEAGFFQKGRQPWKQVNGVNIFTIDDPALSPPGQNPVRFAFLDDHTLVGGYCYGGERAELIEDLVRRHTAGNQGTIDDDLVSAVRAFGNSHSAWLAILPTPASITNGAVLKGFATDVLSHTTVTSLAVDVDSSVRVEAEFKVANRGELLRVGKAIGAELARIDEMCQAKIEGRPYEDVVFLPGESDVQVLAFLLSLRAATTSDSITVTGLWTPSNE